MRAQTRLRPGGSRERHRLRRSARLPDVRAYRGFSVILFAPVAALLAVLLTDPSLVLPMFTSVFMDKMVGFVKNYFPVFLLGAVFGKVIELSASRSRSSPP
jgi:hypothetical protein